MLRAGLLALALLGLAPGLAGARPAVLTAEQMRAFGVEALAKGFADQALEIAEALLARDPGDSSAFVLKAQALRVLHRLPESEAAARAAWASAEDKGSRFSAATAVAQAMSLQDHRTLAQYWLRQAVQNAPNRAAKAQALQDFDYVRSQNPLSLQITTSVQPSDNVNGGTRITSFEFGGVTFPVPANLTALSGVTWSLGVEGGYKLGASPSGATRLTFGASHQGVSLSDASKAAVPGLSGGAFAFDHLSLGLERRSFTGLGQWTFSGALGHNWYGGANLSNTFTADLSLERPFGKGTLTYDAAVTRQMRLDHPGSSSTEVDFSAEIATLGPKGDSWTGRIDLGRSFSGDDRVDHAEAGIGLDWQARHPVAGMTLGASLDLKGADYGGSGRKDGRWQAGLTARFDQASYLGFAPVLSLTFGQTNSNYLLYTTQTFGIGLSIRSRF